MSQDAIIDFSLPCQQALALRQELAFEPRLQVALYWSDPEATITELWNDQEYLCYECLYQDFEKYSMKYSIPVHNAIAFWRDMLSQVKRLSVENTDMSAVLYRLFLSASMDYGSFFSYSVSRQFPESFVRPSELPPDATPAERKCVEVLLNNIKLASPERKQTKYDLIRAFTLWTEHHESAKRYLEWKKQYAMHPTIGTIDTNCYIQRKQMLPLIHVFRQYIHIQNEIANSRYQDFPSAWESFQIGNEDALFFSFQYIFHTLRHNPYIQKIAPVYILYVFQKYTRKLYSALEDDKNVFCPQLNPNDPFPTTKAKFFADVGTNQRMPRKAQVVVYEILCIFFSKYFPDQLAIDYGLCDYIFQRLIPLVGQKRFLVCDDQAKQLISEGHCFSSVNFPEKLDYVHPLMQAISDRLQQSLLLYEKDIPRFSFMLSPTVTPPHITSLAQNVVASDFLRQYEEILVQEPTGIGSEKISDKVLQRLAALFDGAIHTSQKLEELVVKAPPTLASQNLAAFETAIHRFCLTKIHTSVFREVMKSMFTYFQAPAFAEAVCDLERMISISLRDKSNNSTSSS